MSYTCSLVPEAESWAEFCSGTAASEPSKSTPIVEASSRPAKRTAHSRRSRFSQISGPSMLDPTAAELTSWLADFPASRFPQRLEEDRLQMISGRKCSGWLQMSPPGTFLPRTSVDGQLRLRQLTSRLWVTPAGLPLSQRRTWVLITFGSGIGYLHTPTATANFAARSMQKWPACRSFVTVFGPPSPGAFEWMMAWPAGWTDCRPLATDRFRSWQQQHSSCSPQSSTEV